MKIAFIPSILLVILLFLTVCSENEVIEESMVEFGFSIQSGNSDNSRIVDLNDCKYVVVTIKNALHETVYKNKKLELIDSTGVLISEKIPLLIGNYFLTACSVINEEEKIMYVSPIEGSEYAQLVENPLNIEFSIVTEKVTRVTPGILSIEEAFKPAAQIFYVIGDDGYTVSFSAIVENVNTYAWDFGDGIGTSTEADPDYIYPRSGHYMVVLSVTGDSGMVNDTATVIIEPTIKEFLAGGPGDTDGRTWVLSREATIGVDGVSAVDPDYTPLYLPFQNEALYTYGLGVEYDNEFTFYYDGRYTVKGINGAILYGYTYGAVNLIPPIIDPGPAAGMYSGPFTDITTGEWTLHEDSVLTKNSCNEEYPTGVTNSPEDITFSDIDYITLSDSSFLGIRDFNNEVIIRKIDSANLIVSVFMSSLYPDTYPDWYQKPSLLITATYISK